MEQMTIEQLRGWCQARIAELDAYKYMEQVLREVEQAEQRKADAQKHVDALAEQYDVKAEAMEQLHERYASMERVLDERYAAREAHAKAKMRDMDEELGKKQNALETWKDHLSKVEADHQANLAQWQTRIQQARDEHAAMQQKLVAVKAQFESFAALAGKR